MFYNRTENSRSSATIFIGETIMLVRITIMVLRFSVLLALILGIVFWTGNGDSLRPVHIALGILVVLSLWILGFVQATARGGNWGLAVGAFILGLILPIYGLGQD